MKILLTGGTGFIGQRLVKHLQFKHQLVVLSRTPLKAYQKLGHNIVAIQSLDELSDFDDIDAVINLAGEPIADRRWSPKQKDKICQSRWQLTEQLVERINSASTPPATFITGSAIGYYGENPEDDCTEQQHTTDNSFPHLVCRKWEDIALQAQSERTRVCVLRTGVVMGLEGGALAKMLPAFKLGLGGPIASGEQAMSWIHISDMVEAIMFLLSNENCQGAFNLTAPEPVSNQDFSKTLASVLQRPCLLRTPEWLLKGALGDMSVLLTGGQRVLPERLLEAGYSFRYPSLKPALEQLLARQ